MHYLTKGGLVVESRTAISVTTGANLEVERTVNPAMKCGENDWAVVMTTLRNVLVFLGAEYGGQVVCHF